MEGFSLLIALAAAAGHGPPGLPAGAPSPRPTPAIVEVVGMTYGPSPVDGFRSPAGLLLDRETGIFIVADRGNHRLALFDLAGRCRGTVPFERRRDSSSGEPKTLAADREGRLFVVDALCSEVRVLSPRGSELGRLSRPWPEETRAMRPQSVAVGASGRIYVLFAGEAAGLAVFDAKGRFEPQLGIPPDRGALSSPVSIDVNGDESELVIADPGADRQILVCTVDGDVVTAFGERGEGEGTFSLAQHVAWGPSDTLWITDTLRHSISVCDSEGSYLGRIGGMGPGPGQFLHPVACQVLDSGRLLVLERGGERCQLLQLSFGSYEVRSFSLVERGSQRPDLDAS